MGGSEMDVGAIFAKYYGLAKLAQEIQDPATKLRIPAANIPQLAQALQIQAPGGGPYSKDQFASAISQTDELIQKIAAAKEYQEVQYMSVFKSILSDVEKDC